MSYTDFQQNDSKYADHYYSGYTIKSQGCGPASVADAVYDLCDKITPIKTADWMEENGCSCHGCGTYYSGIVKALKHYGYEASQLNYTNLYGKSNQSVVTDFLKKIKSGEYVGIACMGKSIWTTSGHYIFIESVGKNNVIHINDPWSEKKECEQTTRSKFEPYIKYLFLIKKPIKYLKTTKKVWQRSACDVKLKHRIKKFDKGTRLAIDTVKKVGNKQYAHVMYYDCWIVTKNTKETK